MSRNKKWLLLLSVVCFSILLLSVLYSGMDDSAKPNPGEGSASVMPPEQPGDVKKEIGLAVAMHPKEFAVLQQLKDQYESMHPGIVVRLENESAKTAYAKLKKAAQLGDAPDVMLLDNLWVGEFAALGYLLPVDSMFTGEMQALQVEQALAQVKWNGYLWGIPKDIDAFVMVYSAKKLAELHAENPPALAEELVALHKQAHKPDEGKYGIYFDFSDAYSFVTLVRMLGGAKTASKTAPVKLTEPGAMKAIESFLQLPAEGNKEEGRSLAKSFPAASASWKPWEQLAAGKMAGMLTTVSDWKQNGGEGMEMARLPLPRGETAWKAPWLKGRSFAIYSRSEYPKEAFELVKELVSTASAIKFWGAGALPAQLNAYGSPALKSDPAVREAASWIETDDGTAAIPQRNKQMMVLLAELEKLWKGEQTFKTFAEKTESGWNEAKPGAKPEVKTSF